MVCFFLGEGGEGGLKGGEEEDFEVGLEEVRE